MCNKYIYGMVISNQFLSSIRQSHFLLYNYHLSQRASIIN